LVHTFYRAEKYVELYISHIVSACYDEDHHF
jgi:hypothetical protein